MKLMRLPLNNMDQKINDIRAQRLAPFLWVLFLIFILRVIGQMLVALGWQGFLPPMEQWHSGIMPYSWLVLFQIVIIVLYAKICWDFTRGYGYCVTPRRGLGKGLLIFGALYFWSMVIRYVLHMAFHPEARWFGGTIPIFLHCVLATFLLIVGNFHWRYSRKF